MKTSRWFVAAIFGGILLWVSAVGSFIAVAQSSDVDSVWPSTDTSIDNGTIPPVGSFTKTVETTRGGSAWVYSGEQVTYTISIGGIITDAYNATLRVVDLVPDVSSILTSSIHASAGITEVVGRSITWTVNVSTAGAPYSLTYVVQSPYVITPTEMSNTAILHEIDNPQHEPTTKTLSATMTLIVHPWNLQLPIIANEQSTPTPIPTPIPSPTPLPTLPPFESYDFESPNRRNDWEELVNDRPGKLIYSTSENPLENTQGSYYAWLGGATNQRNQITSKQLVTLPAGYESIRVRYRYWVFSQEIDNCTNDQVKVYVNGVEQQIITQDDRQHVLCQVGNTSGWKFAKTENLVPKFAGQSISVSFWTSLNGSRNSNYFLDVVELCSNQEVVNVRSCDFD